MFLGAYVERMNARTLIAAACCALSALCVLPAGCDKKPAPPAALAPADQVYTVRGRVERLPQGPRALAIQHERIADFQNIDGKVIGMKEMVMDFADLSPEAQAALPGLAPGDAVEFVFEVRWKSDPRSRVTSITKLAPGTPLSITPAGCPAATPPK